MEIDFYSIRVPFIPINHLEAHVLSARMERPSLNFPFLAVIISGGHSQFVICKGNSIVLNKSIIIDSKHFFGKKGVEDYVFLGGTVDDAVI